MLSLGLSFLFAIAITVAVLALLRPVARQFDFVDRPGGRKIHDEPVPVVGGLAMWVGFFIGSTVLPEQVRPPVTVMALGMMFVVVGLVDDRFSLPATLRLATQLAAAMAMVWVAEIAVHFVGAPFGPAMLIFDHWPAAILCAILVAGAINAFNMVDGIDGLAGSLALVAFSAIAAVALFSGEASVLAIAGTMAGAVIAFLIFNLPLWVNRKLRTFMGDAGSMFLGFVLSWCLVALSQTPDAAVAPVTLLWFIAMPIYDMFSTAAGRVLKGHSPFHADTTHFHHALLRRGLKTPAVLAVLVVTAIGWATTGWLIDRVFELPDYVSLVAFLFAGAVTSVVIRLGDRL